MSKKAIWNAQRQPYRWHLKSKFANRFDKTHWWKTQKKIEPRAALYELMRRHPAIGKKWNSNTNHRTTLAFAATYILSLKPWTKLTPVEKENWAYGIPLQKGLDLRDDHDGVVSLRDEAEALVKARRNQLLLDRGVSYTRLDAAYRKKFGSKPIPKKKINAVIMEVVVRHLNAGASLIAILPNLPFKRATALIPAHLKKAVQPTIKSRARPQQWLHTISEFEDTEMHHGSAKRDVFARYKRVIESVSFDTV